MHKATKTSFKQTKMFPLMQRKHSRQLKTRTHTTTPKLILSTQVVALIKISSRLPSSNHHKSYEDEETKVLRINT